MVTISGRVVFDRDRSATINAGDSGIANVLWYYKISLQVLDL